MPAVASQPPSLATDFKAESMAAADPDRPVLRRDSRLVEYQSPIPEEDESNETASEPAEPITPTSDTAPCPHPFKHHDAAESLKPTPKSDMATLTLTTTSTTLNHPTAHHASDTLSPSTPISRVQSRPARQAAADQGAAPDKPTIGRRVGSFVRNKLQRTPSAKEAPPAAPKTKTEQVIVKTGVDGPKEVSAPAVNIPKYRRLSSFSLSARNSPRSSHGNSPPSPSSPTSTISDEHLGPPEKDHLHRKHSSSSTAISSMTSQRPGISWAGGGRDSKKHSRFTRRRSASTEIVPKIRPEDDKTIGLLDTFSKPAVEGVGMKARRLSLSLPDEFVVDSCELDKEFKSSSFMPGKRGKCLGRGATAEVRIMARKGTFNNEELVAVKEFRIRERDENEEEYIKKIKSEYSIAKSLHHPNVVETVRLCTSKGRWNHVMEFCAHGELFSLVERKLFSNTMEGYYSVNDRLCFFKQLLRGVDYLHSHGIAHRDIKLENLLLSKEGHLKISDFGVAEVFSGEHPGLRASGGECGKNMGEIRLSKPGICGSLPYIAPEVLEKNGSYDPRRLDVWSCAIVYLTMTFQGSPWQAAKPEYEYYARFKKGWDEWLPEHPDGEITDAADGHPKCGMLFSHINPPAIKRLLLKMLHPIPEKRITIREVMNTTCIKGIDCCCPENYEDPRCGIDASKCTSKQTSKMIAAKKHLHHHIPPQPERKVAKVLQHRFDLGDGWN